MMSSMSKIEKFFILIVLLRVLLWVPHKLIFKELLIYKNFTSSYMLFFIVAYSLIAISFVVAKNSTSNMMSSIIVKIMYMLFAVLLSTEVALIIQSV